MPESAESKPKSDNIERRRRMAFIPRTMGIFFLLIIILAFTAGALRRELALVLAGAVFLAVWTYCLLMTLILAVIHSRRVRRVSIRISPREVSTGESVQVMYSEGDTAAPGHRIFQLPGILVRCRLLLAAKDGRRIWYDFDCADSVLPSFTAEKRGAYFSAGDEFAVFDILGFFRFVFRLSAEDGARLLVSPHAADEPPCLNARAGESKLMPEFSFQRTDNLIEHRPYVPGDDPRRINWKLYSHGGGLFVREGEREPPPHSNISILIDTEYDPLLYSAGAARREIDLLCENALAAAIACAESGMAVFTGYSVSSHTGHANNERKVPELVPPAKLAASLAWPAALPVSASPHLPSVPDAAFGGDNCGILVLALPRSGGETQHHRKPAALDRFLRNVASSSAGQNKIRPVDILFLFSGFTGDDSSKGSTMAYSERLAAAEVCTVLYNQRPGVRARMAGV